MDGWLTMREVAEHLGRSIQSVGNYRRYCGLPATRRGNAWFARLEDVEEWRNRPEVAAMLAAGVRRATTRWVDGRPALAGEGA